MSPWGIQFPNFPGHAGFFIVQRGNAWLNSNLLQNPVALTGGDFVIFPHGAAYQLRDKPQTKVISVEKLVKPNVNLITHGGGGALSVFVHGCFQFDGVETNPLVAALPKVIHLKGEEIHASPWLETTLQYLFSEMSSDLPASETVILHLTEVVFIQALRAFMKQEGESCKQKGLIHAIADRRIGEALAFIHNHPEQEWTVGSLAAKTGMSRAAFAQKFHELVQEPPLQYLTRWRMHKATSYLRSGNMSLGAIADQIGYESEAAFSKAFRRWMGKPPGAYRKEQVIERKRTGSSHRN